MASGTRLQSRVKRMFGSDEARYWPPILHYRAGGCLRYPLNHTSLTRMVLLVPLGPRRG